MLKSFQKKRLLRLADYLDNHVKDERFNLEVIATTETCELPSQSACGTAACAIGHMPQVFSRHCKYSEIDPDCLETVTHDYPFTLEVEGKGELENYKDFTLANAFFGLNQYESQYLFMPDEYGARKGRKTVAHRIRKFVVEGRIPKDHRLYDRAWDIYYEQEDAINNEETEELVEEGC
jgi:hypothetical protein